VKLSALPFFYFSTSRHAAAVHAHRVAPPRRLRPHLTSPSHAPAASLQATRVGHLNRSEAPGGRDSSTIHGAPPLRHRIRGGGGAGLPFFPGDEASADWLRRAEVGATPSGAEATTAFTSGRRGELHRHGQRHWGGTSAILTACGDHRGRRPARGALGRAMVDHAWGATRQSPGAWRGRREPPTVCGGRRG
jgi:hypothetical protein